MNYSWWLICKLAWMSVESLQRRRGRKERVGVIRADRRLQANRPKLAVLVASPVSIVQVPHRKRNIIQVSFRPQSRNTVIIIGTCLNL